jgi:hypothetical protein
MNQGDNESVNCCLGRKTQDTGLKGREGDFIQGMSPHELRKGCHQEEALVLVLQTGTAELQ